MERDMAQDEMTSIAIAGGVGGADALMPVRTPMPVAADHEILIRVAAAGVNRPDIAQRMGLYAPPPDASPILGLEVAGVVEQAAGRWGVGDRVCALVNGGGYAEYVRVDASQALPVPDGFGWEDAASLPETIFTVYANVFGHGALKAGETFLVHGANSGIGVTAIQMARLAGATVITTARGRERSQRALDLGADRFVDLDSEDYVEAVRTAGGADVILDMLGGGYVARDLDALRPGGRIVLIAALTGDDIGLSAFRLMQKRAILTGSLLRPRTPDEKAAIAAGVEGMVWPWLATGRMRPQVDRVFALEEAAAAHAYLEGGAHIGKVVLRVGGFAD